MGRTPGSGCRRTDSDALITPPKPRQFHVWPVRSDILSARTPWTVWYGLHPFSHHRVAQRSDPFDFYLDPIAMLHIRSGPLGAHPDDVARIQRQARRHVDQKIDHTEDH